MDMKTDQILAWAVLVIVIIIGAWYFSTDWTTPTTSSPTATTTAATTTTPEKPAAKVPAPSKPSAPSAPSATTVTAKVILTGYNSLNYLRGQKEPLFCSFNSNAAQHHTGNLFIAGGTVRANIAQVPGGATFGTYMIDNGTNLYAWHQDAVKGLKLLAANSANGSVMANYGALDPAAELSFSCTSWTTDESLLTPPSNVTFSNNP